MTKIKQVLIWQAGLRNHKGEKCRTGKIVAQLAHASMKVLLDMMYYSTDYGEEDEANYAIRTLDTIKDGPIDQWLEGSFTKICVSVDSEKELDDIYQSAQDAGIPCSLIIDNGATEFNGIKTKTACAIGPWYSDQIDKITGSLKLL